MNIYDPKSYELAQYFLQDCAEATQKDFDSLAMAIQDAVENWLTGKEDKSNG